LFIKTFKLQIRFTSDIFQGDEGPSGPPGPPGPPAEAPLLPPELLFRMTEFSNTKAEERVRRDVENMPDLEDEDIDELMGLG
jgi:collagen type V/XI/XXIV/XXVII, alpha